MNLYEEIKKMKEIEISSQKKKRIEQMLNGWHQKYRY